MIGQLRRQAVIYGAIAATVPKRFLAVEDLPRTGTNKVQKTELRELFLS